MYAVSQAYRDAMRLPVQRFGASGTVGGAAFTEADLLSLSVSNQCSDANSVKIGQVYVGELRAVFTAEFVQSGGLDRYGWTGAEIVLSVKMDVSGLNAPAETWESVPIGVYTVPSDGVSWTQEGVEVTAYDNLSKLDRIQAVTRRRGETPFQIARSYANRAGVELGQTQAEFEALPNGREKFYLPITETGKTGRDVFAWLGEVLGCFATAGRDGKLYFRPYSRTVADTLDPAHRWQGCRFGDYTTRYSMVKVTNTADKAVYWAELDGLDLLRYDLGENPLLQSESEAVIRARLHNILTALQAVNYVPFEATAIGNPAYDLGDVLRFPGGIGDEAKLFCITSFTFTLNQGYRMSGAGENPELANARSGEYKALESSENTTVDELHSLFLRNPSAVTVSDGGAAVPVLEAAYSTAAGSHVEVHGEILLDVETTETGDAASGWICNDAVVTVTYEADGTAVTDRSPVQAYQDGRQALSLQYDFVVGRGYAHEFRVLLSVTGGSVSVDAGGGLLSLTGIGVGDTPEDYPEDPEGIAYIEVRTMPEKQGYLTGEALDYSGVEVIAVGYDETEQDVTELCTFTPSDGADAPEEPGPLLVNVEYADGGETYTAAFDLSIRGIRSISITQLPNKTSYTVGESIDITGMAVTAVLTDGEEMDITEACTTIPADGEKILTEGHIITVVQYKGADVGQFEMEAGPRGVIVGGDWWTLYSDGELDIFCDGDMPYTYPWEENINNVTSVVLKNSVTSIGAYAFQDCTSLTSATIPGSVTSIGPAAFWGCSSLTSVTIHSGVTNIGNGAFYNCTSLTNVTIPGSVISIGDGAFSMCSHLTSITISSGVTNIGRNAFIGCISLTSVAIPGSVTSIGANAFQDCTSLTSVTIHSGVTSIGGDAFWRCSSLTNVTIPSSVTSIAGSAFRDCSSLTSITIPSGVTIIDYSVFYNCSNLTSVTIPDSVTSVRRYAFYNCRALSDVYYSGTENEWNSLDIGTYNTRLTTATIHYNSTGP